MSLNAAKTLFILFFAKQSDLNYAELIISDSVIKPSMEATYLGLNLHYRLSWSNHFKIKTRSSMKAFHGAMKCLRVSWGLSRSSICTLYYSIAEPILLYGCSL